MNFDNNFSIPNANVDSEGLSYDSEDLSQTNNNNRPSKRSIFTDENDNLKVVNFIVRNTCLVFFLIIGLCIISTLILVRLARQTGNPFTDNSNSYDIYDIRSIAYDSVRVAKVQLEKEIIANNGRRLDDVDQPQKSFGDLTYWIYEAETADGLFTDESIPIIRGIENTILNHPDYPEYCQLNYNIEPPQCVQPLSAMNIYYASQWNSTVAQNVISELTDVKVDLYNALSACVEYNQLCDKVDPSIDTPANKLWVAETSQKINGMIRYWDGKGDLNPNVDEVSLFMAYINQLRTKAASVNFFTDMNFTISHPVATYARSISYWGKLLNGTSTDEESGDKLKKFIIDELYDDWTDITQKNHNPEFNSYYFMVSLIFDVILEILVVDGVKAIASFLAVFFYLRFMLGSWFLTAVGMFEIVMSLPLSWLFFSYIFQVKYFSTLNVLAIFIVMAIGADDIFVFMDAYKQSASKKEHLSSLESRMSYVFRRSGSAMLLTSVTTCSAFLCTLASPITDTRSFGIFAAFVIFFDYVLVMSLFCTSVVIYHNRFEGKRYCCNCTFWVKNNPTPTEKAALETQEEGGEWKMDRMSTFFKEKFAPFILQTKNRLIILVLLLGWIILAAIYSSKLQPTMTTEQFLDDDHPLQRGATILSEKFTQTQRDETAKIHFVWGVDEISRKGVNQLLNPEYVGDVTFTETFEFNEECQTEMLNACIALKSDTDLEEFIQRKDGLRRVDCFVEELGAFNALGGAATCEEVKVGDWQSLAWQVSSNEISSTVGQLLNKPTCNDDDDNPTIRKYYEDSLGFDGQSIRYVGLSVDSSILNIRRVQSETLVRKHYDKFIEVAERLDETLQGACNGKVIMTDLEQKFIFMNNQRIYRTSGVTGSMIGVAIAFGVLLLSTRKLHISAFASICILCVLISVVGCITMLGWTLGVIEAILVSILAGFSVDYTIHLAHAYVHAEGSTEDRIKEAFSEMGVTVFSGMFTSIVASIPLFFCTLTFFAKFGTFLCLTISLSWIFANFGLMSMLAQFKIPMNKGWL